MPARHRSSLNISIFQCQHSETGESMVDGRLHGGWTACGGWRTFDVKNSSTNGTLDIGTAQSSLRNNEQCSENHTGQLCASCRTWYVDRAGYNHTGQRFSQGFEKQCELCDTSSRVVAMTVTAMVILALILVALYRYFEKRAADLEEVKLRYTVLTVSISALSNLRFDAGRI